jgi:hypothetical protein
MGVEKKHARLLVTIFFIPAIQELRLILTSNTPDSYSVEQEN